MPARFTNQILAQIALFVHGARYGKDVHGLPKRLDEKVAARHLPKFRAQLTQRGEAQAACIDVPREGPFKPERYRY